MKPTPRRLPHLTAGLLIGGMGLFLGKGLAARPFDKLLVAGGMLVFLAGLLVALVGMAWSIWTLTSPGLRRSRGVATPVVAILIAALAWAGTLLTIYKYKKTHDAHVATAAHGS
jgi:hypothetical protein